MPALASNSGREPAVSVEPVLVCHAGGRGFESRRSRLWCEVPANRPFFSPSCVRSHELTGSVSSSNGRSKGRTPFAAPTRWHLTPAIRGCESRGSRRSTDAYRERSTRASRSTWTEKAASRHTCSKDESHSRRRSPTLNRYEATTHFNGQSTVTIDGDRATGESYTIAHHLFSEDGDRKIMIASLRYLDTFAKIDGSWYFAERKLLLDWSETRPSAPGV